MFYAFIQRRIAQVKLVQQLKMASETLQLDRDPTSTDEVIFWHSFWILLYKSKLIARFNAKHFSRLAGLRNLIKEKLCSKAPKKGQRTLYHNSYYCLIVIVKNQISSYYA